MPYTDATPSGRTSPRHLKQITGDTYNAEPVSHPASQFAQNSKFVPIKFHRANQPLLVLECLGSTDTHDNTQWRAEAHGPRGIPHSAMKALLPILSYSTPETPPRVDGAQNPKPQRVSAGPHNQSIKAATLKSLKIYRRGSQQTANSHSQGILAGSKDSSARPTTWVFRTQRPRSCLRG